MSLIHCTCGCAYQSDGYCGLENAGEITEKAKGSDCLHFVKRVSYVQNKSAPENIPTPKTNC